MSDDCICDWPDECSGLGSLQCEGCGGDICVCPCGGEAACPGCEYCEDGGEFGEDFEDEDDNEFERDDDAE